MENPLQSVNSFSPQVLPRNFTGASGFGTSRAGVTKPLAPGTGEEASARTLVRVRSSVHKPDSKEVFAAVQYHGAWFWIDDRDLPSKRGMSFLMLLFTLASPGATIHHRR
jgi:hypothetical protein